MTPEDILLKSAEWTANQIDTDQSTKHIKVMLSSCGKSVLPHLTERDSPGLFAPAQFVRGGKQQPGLVLALDERAIFAWSEGILRVKNFEVVVP